MKILWDIFRSICTFLHQGFTFSVSSTTVDAIRHFIATISEWEDNVKHWGSCSTARRGSLTSSHEELHCSSSHHVRLTDGSFSLWFVEYINFNLGFQTSSNWFDGSIGDFCFQFRDSDQTNGESDFSVCSTGFLKCLQLWSDEYDVLWRRIR